MLGIFRRLLPGFLRHGSAASFVDPSSPPDRWGLTIQDRAALWSRASVIRFPLVFSAYSGRGIGHSHKARSTRHSARGCDGDFRGFRAFEPGDDSRRIDWRATLRSRRPMIRESEPESTASVFLVVDVSASMYCPDDAGSRPVDLAFEIAVWLAAAAFLRQLPVDLVLTSDREEAQFSGYRGRRCLEPFIRALAEFRPEGRTTDWTGTLASISRRRAASHLFLISDLTWLPEPSELRRTMAGNMPRAVRVAPRSGRVLAGSGRLFADAESGGIVDSSALLSPDRIAHRAERWATAAGCSFLELSADQPRPELSLAAWLRGSRTIRREGDRRHET